MSDDLLEIWRRALNQKVDPHERERLICESRGVGFLTSARAYADGRRKRFKRGLDMNQARNGMSAFQCSYCKLWHVTDLCKDGRGI
jgi:hypothetical protein